MILRYVQRIFHGIKQSLCKT